MNKNIILYIEDEPIFAKTAKDTIKYAFPKYRFEWNKCYPGCASRIHKELEIDRVAIVCADRHLPEHTWGWDVVEELKQKGYCGPTVYIGGTRLPEEKKHLFSDVADKFGPNLIETLRKYL